VSWLNKVIEEAKIQYIHSELQKQELREKELKDKGRKKCNNYSSN
jgi:hypothetical protein